MNSSNDYGKNDCHIERSCLSYHTLEAQTEMRASNTLCDACIRLDDGGCIYVHRIVMCASCEYFRALFTSPLNRNIDLNDVHIKLVRSDILQNIVDFVYARVVDINEKNVIELIITADYFGYKTLVDHCANFIVNILNSENCISLMLMARSKLHSPELQTKTKMYVLRNFNKISVISRELLELSIDEFYDIISDDMLNVKDEELVWDCCLRWIDFDKNNRLEFVRRLLDGTRLGLLHMSYFLLKVKDHEYVRYCAEARPVIIATLRFMSDLDTISNSDKEFLTPLLAIPRLPHEVIFTIGGWFDGGPRSMIEAYDTRADRWIKVSEEDPDGPRAYHGAAAIDHKIYCIGGYNGIENFNSCRVFDVVERKWQEIAPMHSRRCYVSVCALNGKIYAMGGHDGIDRLRTVECYCPETNQWTILQSMSTERSDAHACVLNEKIYIIGGFSGSQCLDTGEYFDNTTNTWTIISEMSTRRSGLSCVVYQNKLYAIGGFNGAARLNTGEKYDPITNNWSSIKEMSTPRSNFGIEVIDDMIFVIGGFDGVTTIDQTQCYIVEKNEWLEATSMTHVRSAFTATVLVGLPNIADFVYKDRSKLLEERRIFLADRLIDIPY